MKRYIYTLFIGVILSFTSCTMTDVDQIAPTPSGKGGLHIIGAAAEFNNHHVGTRAEEAYSDSYISEMTMFVFDANKNLVQGFDAEQKPVSSAINIPQSNPTFLIEAKKYNGTGIISSMGASLNIKYFNNKDANLSSCSIYIVANAYDQIKHLINGDESDGEIKKLDDLNDAVLKIGNTLTMPAKQDGTVIGFPMIGHAVTPDEQIATFDLRYNANADTGNAVANIPLIKLYSKVYFAMQINSNQIVKDGPTPKFTIDRAEVYNVPTKVRMGAYTEDYVQQLGDNYQFNSGTDPFVISDFSNKTIYHTNSKEIEIGNESSNLIEFCFYMPEHKVTPNNLNPYPSNLPDSLKQYYKPKLVGAGNEPNGLAVGAKKATFVRIHGSYTDHNGRIKGVSYDVYLGQNNSDDFEVRRNQQLINRLIITGLTNHKDAYFGGNVDNISIDHRVTMTDRGYNVYMEREAILDSHFEVRPVDFELQNGSALTIVIPEECRSWIAMENDDQARSGENSGLYIDNTNVKRGVRKYFTTNLVGELTGANSGQITLEHSSRFGGTNTDTEHFRVWFYIDENPNVYDQTGTGKQTSESGDHTVSKTQFRNVPVKLYYTNNATDNPDVDKEAVHTINFQQWNLWRVWNAVGNRYYDIEHEEEYLNNYASNQGYGPQQNGMPYGLEGIQLSNHNKAVYVDASKGVLGWLIEDVFNGNYDSWINSMIDKSGLAPFYDFYLERDTRPVNIGYRNYSGKKFNQEIVKTLDSLYLATSDVEKKKKVQVEDLWLTHTPTSAIAYCYHKNKRDKNGKVETFNWYLPAIDEIEEIQMGAYGEFDKVFQKQKYWSCQPAAFNKILRLERERWIIVQLSDEVQNGQYMDDDVDRARATSVLFDPSNPNANQYGYVNISSGTNGVEGTFTLHFKQFGDFVPGESGYDPDNIGDNKKTNYLNPDHLGNLPRTERCRIRAVYRSGTGTRSSN